MLGELVKAVLERALEAELTAHLGYERHDWAGRRSGNSRNGTIAKTVQTGVGPVPLAVPRDRAGTFEPLLVPKRAGRIAGGLDDMVISLYAHGMSVRDILHHLEQVYGTQLSPETVSRITDGCWRRSGRGSPGRWSRSTPWCSWTRSWSRSATTTWCRTSPPTSPSAIDGDGEKHVLGIGRAGIAVYEDDRLRAVRRPRRQHAGPDAADGDLNGRDAHLRPAASSSSTSVGPASTDVSSGT